MATFLSGVKSGDVELIKTLISGGGLDINSGEGGRSALMIAVIKGFVGVVGVLMERGALLDLQDQEGMTALMHACHMGHLTVVGLLLKGGAQLNLIANDGQSAFIFACNGGHYEVAKVLLDAGAVVDMEDSEALIHACHRGDLKVAKLLTERGPKVNLKVNLIDNKGRSALMHACCEGHTEVVNLLLNKGALVDLQDYEGNSALTYAFDWGHFSVVNLLLNKGALVDFQDHEYWISRLLTACGEGDRLAVKILRVMKNDKGYTPLMYVCGENRYSDAEMLLKKDATVNLVDSNGCSALMQACGKGAYDIAVLLLNHGAQPFLTDNNGWSALMHACNGCNLEVAELLLKHSKTGLLDLIDSNGCSALMHACGKGAYNITVLLLKYGAKPFLTDNNGWSALIHACNGGSSRVARLLLKNSIELQLDGTDKNGCSALMHASRKGSYDTAKVLLDAGADVDLTDSNGWSALMHASDKGHSTVAQLLLENYCSIHLKDSRGSTALMHACMQGFCAVAQLLLNWGATVDCIDSNGCSALMYACGDKGSFKIVESLLGSWANVNLVDNSGWSALLYASQWGHYEAAELLLKNGASVEFLDHQGYSALMHSCANGHYKVSEVLLEHGAQHSSGSGVQSALMHACNGGHCEVAELLLKHGALVDFQDKQASSALIYACAKGDIGITRLLLKYGAQVNLLNSKGWSPLMHACDGGHHIVALLLLENGALVDLQGSISCSALIRVCSKGDYDIAKILLERGAQVQLKDNNGWSALIHACDGGHYEVAELLLEYDAPIDMRDDEGCSALIRACGSGHHKVAKFLLEKGARIDLCDNNGCSALIHACSGAFCKVARLLLKAGASVDLQDKLGGSALIYSCAVGFYREIKTFLEGTTPDRILENSLCTLLTCYNEDYSNVAKLLLEQNASVNLIDTEGYSPLILACFCGDYKMVKLLLDKGADVDQQCNVSALMVTSLMGHYDVAEMLLNSGAQVNLLDNNGISPLLFSTYNAHTDVAQLLLENGAQIDQRLSNGWSPLMLASWLGHHIMVGLLLDCDAQVDLQDCEGQTALTIAIKKDHLDVVNLLLEKEFSWSAMFFAVTHGKCETVKLVLQHWLQIDLFDDNGFSPLMLACQHGQHRVAKLLLEKGAKVDLQNDLGQSALLFASQAGHLEVAKLLLDKGALVDLQDHELRSSLMLASEKGHSKVVKLLLEKGAQIDLEDHRRQSSLLYACQGKSHEVIKLLLNNGADPSGLAALGLTGNSEITEEPHNQEELDPEVPPQKENNDSTKSQADIVDQESGDATVPASEIDEGIEPNEFIQDIEEALSRNEEIERKLAHGMFVGLPGSGKSSLMDRLLGRPRKMFSPSTGVSEGVVVVDVGAGNPSTFHSVTVIDGDTWKEVEYDTSLVRQVEENVTTSEISTERSTTITSQATETQLSEESVHPPPEPTLILPTSSITSSLETVPQEPVSQADGTATKPITVKPHVKEMIRVIIRKCGGYRKFKKFLAKSFTLYLRDTGGQVEFQEMLPLLIFGPSIFFFIFRLDLDFNRKFSVEYRKTPTESINQYTSSITTEEAFLQCLASVDAMDTAPGEASIKTHQPRVFVIGTHKDMLGSSAEERIAGLNKHLHSLVTKRDFIRDLVQYADRKRGHVMFTVDNTSGSDEDFKPIRSKVNAFIRGREEFTIKYPIRYLLFCLELQNEKGSVLSLDECTVMAAKYGIHKHEILNLLQFLHLRIGVIRYFNKDGVSHIVIKEPQVLFNMVTSLVIKTFSCEALSDREAQDFDKKGILTASALASVFGDIEAFNAINPEEFLQLLVHLRLIASFSIPGKQEKRYFIPSVLNHVPESSEEKRKTDVLPLAVQFKCEHCPKGLFGVLVTHLMTSDPDEHEAHIRFILIQNKIFKNQVSFEVCSSGERDEISLKVHVSHLEINFYPENSEERETSIAEVCSSVRTMLEVSIDKSLRDLHYSKSKIEPMMCLRCDDCSELHPVQKGKKFKIHCRSSRTARCIPSQGQYWYIEDCKTTLLADKSTTTTKPSDHKDHDKISSGTTASQAVLNNDDLFWMYEKLRPHSSKWRQIALGLGFTDPELKNIESAPLLLTTAPYGYLHEVLSSWLQWAPGDARGSRNYATLQLLREVVDGAGLGRLARELKPPSH